jgi:hypothetical protein
MTCIATKVRRGHKLRSIWTPAKVFLRRLDCYTRVPLTPGVIEIFMETLVELVSTLSLVTRQYEQGLLSEFSSSRHF